jgi:ribosomal protein S18 acetylase RimI-like enzyme
MNAIHEKALSAVDLEPDERRTEIRIRAYMSSDYAAMLTIWQEAELHPFTEIEVDRLLSSGGGVLVAEAGSASETPLIVGTLLWSHNGQSAWLWKLAVARRFRHQGIARRLLRQVEQDAAAAGLSGVALLTRETNTAAQSLYNREGWKQSAIHQFWGKRLTTRSAEQQNYKEQTEC